RKRHTDQTSGMTASAPTMIPAGRETAVPSQTPRPTSTAAARMKSASRPAMKIGCRRSTIRMRSPWPRSPSMYATVPSSRCQPFPMRRIALRVDRCRYRSGQSGLGSMGEQAQHSERAEVALHHLADLRPEGILDLAPQRVAQAQPEGCRRVAVNQAEELERIHRERQRLRLGLPAHRAEDASRLGAEGIY